MRQSVVSSAYGLEHHGITRAKAVHWNLNAPALYEAALRRGEGKLAADGPLLVLTRKYTGRSPNDKFIVRDSSTEDLVWWNQGNRPFEPAQFEALKGRVLDYFQSQELFPQDCYVGADPEHRIAVRVVTENAWHSLFARNMFLQPTAEEQADYVPQWTVIHGPHFEAIPERDSTNSEAFVILDFQQQVVLIGGTRYAGEVKKSIFTVMNYLLPQKGILPMHCAANLGPEKGDVALFFGLSGTGKTTLSVVADRVLIGDDEHGWGDQGIFNFEGGCYAKVIRLSAEAEPEIYQTTRRFGTVLENVVMDPVTRELDLDDESLTENTRDSYPMSQVLNSSSTGLGGHPNHLFMLTADAFGVMPPIAKLTPEQAKYYFLSGYTAKVAGTERGLTEPEATFSTCFGAPFMPLHPSTYANLLGEKIARHQAQAWLINTGWTGGAYGVGQRMKIGYTRAMIRAALTGALAQVPMELDPVFGVQVPTACPEVPSEVLKPRNTWADPQAYDLQAKKVASMFNENFQQFADRVTSDVRDAGPRGG